MESIGNGQHRGPAPRVIIKPEALARAKAEKSGKKGNLTEAQKLEAKRAAARAYYHANKERIAKRDKARHAAEKANRENLPTVSDEGPPTTVPKRPSKIDALVCINRSIRFLQQGDPDGGELWARFAARIMEGKE